MYYDQVLVWEECGGGAECTTAIAPMNWDDPSEGPDIELALTRHAANGQKQGSLFVNPGGPGGSGYDFIHDSVDFAVSSRVQNNFDVIGWDPRGVGRSTPVTCFDDAGLDDYLWGLPSADADTDPAGWTAEVTASAVEFGQSCLENTGPVLQYVDTISTVRDLDMLRAIVGDEKLNYLGYSYGTSIGTRYIDRFAGQRRAHRARRRDRPEAARVRDRPRAVRRLRARAHELPHGLPRDVPRHVPVHR